MSPAPPEPRTILCYQLYYTILYYTSGIRKRLFTKWWFSHGSATHTSNFVCENLAHIIIMISIIISIMCVISGAVCENLAQTFLGLMCQ